MVAVGGGGGEEINTVFWSLGVLFVAFFCGRSDGEGGREMESLDSYDHQSCFHFF